MGFVLIWRAAFVMTVYGCFADDILNEVMRQLMGFGALFFSFADEVMI